MNPHVLYEQIFADAAKLMQDGGIDDAALARGIMLALRSEPLPD